MSMAAHPMPPPLRDGDHLTSDEFMHRWEAMPNLKHAELIDGIVLHIFDSQQPALPISSHDDALACEL